MFLFDVLSFFKKGDTIQGQGGHYSREDISKGNTVVCRIVHKIASVWCKIAQGEVGVSLP